MPASIDRIMSIVVFRMLLLGILAIAACGKSCGDKQGDAGFVLNEACKRAFLPSLDAFEVALKTRVPEKCRVLDKTYPISVVSDADEMRTICGGGPLSKVEVADNEALTGCFLKQPPLLVIFKRDERSMTDTAVHEWLHILMLCTLNTPDEEHMQGALWKEYEKDRGLGTSAEIQAQSLAEAGKCVL